MLLATLRRLRYKLGFRDELLLQRGFEISHESVRTLEVRFLPLVADGSQILRARRRRYADRSWYLTETYVRSTDDGATCTGRLIVVATCMSLRETTARRCRFEAPTLDDRQARLREGNPLDKRGKGSASAQSVSEQSDGAESPAHQAALLPDARVQAIRVSEPVLHSIRRVTQLPEGKKIWRPHGYRVRQSRDLQDKMVDTNSRAVGAIVDTDPNSTRPQFGR